MSWLAVPAAVSGIALLAGGASTVVAALLRINDRHVPTWLVRLMSVLFGLAASIAVLVWPGVDDLFDIVFAVGVGVVPAALLARSGRFVLAGLYLIAAGLPAVVGWAYVTSRGLPTDEESIVDPVVAGLLAPALMATVGGALILLGDRPRHRRDLPAPDQPDPSRTTSLAMAMQEELRFGPVSLPEFVAMGTGVVAASVAVIAIDAIGLPGPVAALAAVAAFAVVATELFYHGMPKSLATAMATHSFLGSWEVRRFRETTGTAPPTSAAAARRWLDQHPETDDNRWVRPELLAWAGDLTTADDVLSRLPAETDVERFERQSIQVHLDLVAGRPADVAGLAAAAEQVGEPASDERLRAVAAAAIAEARRRLAYGEPDWKEPLIAAQERIGPRALGVLRSDTWSRRFVALALGALAVAGLSWTVGLLGA